MKIRFVLTNSMLPITVYYYYKLTAQFDSLLMQALTRYL